RHVSISRYEQEAELKAIRADFPEYAVHSHIPHNVLARLGRTYQALFRRLARGEKAGFPAAREGLAITPSPARSTVTARGSTMATRCAPKLGHPACAGRAPSRGHPRSSPPLPRPIGGMSRSPALMSPSIPCLPPGRRRRSTLAWSHLPH